MMDWDTYATLLHEEQKERAEKGLSPLFNENQQELLAKENRQKMITAMRMMEEACHSNESWRGYEECFLDSVYATFQRSAIKHYKRNHKTSCPITRESDDIKGE